MHDKTERAWTALLTERLQTRCFLTSHTTTAGTAVATTQIYLAELLRRQPVQIPLQIAVTLLDDLRAHGLLELKEARCWLTPAGQRRSSASALLDDDARLHLRAIGETALRARVIPPADDGPLSQEPGSARLNVLRGSREAAGWLIGTIVRDAAPEDGAYPIARLRTALRDALAVLLRTPKGGISRTDADAVIRSLLDAGFLHESEARRYAISRQGADVSEQYSRESYTLGDDPDDLPSPPEPGAKPRTTKKSLRATLADGLGAQLFASLLRSASRNYDGGIDADEYRATIRRLIIEYKLDPAWNTQAVIGRYFQDAGWLQPLSPRRYVEAYAITVAGREAADADERTGT